MFKPITINYLRLEFFSTPGVQESRKRKTALLQRDSGILLALNLWHRTGFGGQVRPDSVTRRKDMRVTCDDMCIWPEKNTKRISTNWSDAISVPVFNTNHFAFNSCTTSQYEPMWSARGRGGLFWMDCGDHCRSSSRLSHQGAELSHQPSKVNSFQKSKHSWILSTIYLLITEDE